MTDVTVIYAGNTKESYFLEALAEYRKRLGAFCRFTEIEIKEEKCDSPAEVSRCLEKEGERIIAAFPKRAYRIALCVEGRQFSSEEFAEISDSKEGDGIVFVIGSSFGLSDAVKNACDLKLSFSKMTLPHRLMRVVLYEQIFRACAINHGRRYHK